MAGGGGTGSLPEPKGRVESLRISSPSMVSLRYGHKFLVVTSHS